MPNDDCIKRSELIEHFNNFDPRYGLIDQRKVVDDIRDFPAADVEPKRKTGQWIVAGAFDDFYQCPECGNMWPIFSTIEWAFCPVCGCRTRTPKEGENV